MASTSPTPTSLIRVSASGRSFDRTISELVSGSSGIHCTGHAAPPAPTVVAELSSSDGPRSRALALTDLLHHPHILYTDTKCYSTLISIVLCCATPPSYSYWYKVLLHPHIHSTLLCYTTLIFIVLCCATPPSYSHWYNVKRHLHILSTLFCYTTLMFSPSLSLCYQVLHHPHIHGATIQFSTATLCCIYAAIAKCHSLIDSAILCYIVLHQPHTFIVVHGATTPSYS